MDIQQLQDEVKQVNETHWKRDYNDKVQPSDMRLRNRLAQRKTPLMTEAIQAGLLCMDESGPCACYAYSIKA